MGVDLEDNLLSFGMAVFTSISSSDIAGNTMHVLTYYRYSQ